MNVASSLNDTTITISVKGRPVEVPCLHVGTRTIIASGKWLKVAEVRDEAWLAGDVVEDPEADIERMKQQKFPADIFTFTQKLPNASPKYHYPIEWDNVAAIPTKDYLNWWEQRVSQVVRKNVRRSVKRGLTIRDVPFSDDLLRRIVEIINETPVRQGRLFWHFGKTFEEVKKDYSGLMDRSQYFGAYFGEELVGFIKMVYMGEIAGILQLLCKQSHQDKRAANALLARAVEVCHEKGLKYLIYGQYIYGNKADSPLTEFKRRNGFEQMLIPRYYIPLTLKGKLALQVGLHRGFKPLLPQRVYDFGLKLRAMWYEKRLGWTGNKSTVSNSPDNDC